MDIDNVSNVRSEQTGLLRENSYMGTEIVFLNSMKDLPMNNGTFRVDRLVSVICYTGKLQMDINMTTYTIRAGQVAICHQNDAISNAMQSPDFDGAVLSLSAGIIMEMFGESNMWDCFFHLANNPIVNARPESLEILRIYYDAFRTKMSMGHTPFHKEIVFSIIKSVFYELMENIDDHSYTNMKGLRHGEILFKQFIDLLTGSVVKSRNVAWYAGQLCITPKHLSTVCKRVSGKTAFDWINEYVAIDIRHLLKNSDKSIKEIVDMLRFPNASFFGSYCRKHFGMAPKEYRRYLRSVTGDNITKEEKAS